MAWREDLELNIVRLNDLSVSKVCNMPILKFSPYTTSNLPDPEEYFGSVIFVLDIAQGVPQLALSDGVKWSTISGKPREIFPT